MKLEMHIGLKEALVLVEEVDKATNPNYRAVNMPAGCAGSVFKIAGWTFAIIGILFLAIAGAIYYGQDKTIKNSERISGVVVDFWEGDNGGTAPVIRYTGKG